MKKQWYKYIHKLTDTEKKELNEQLLSLTLSKIKIEEEKAAISKRLGNEIKDKEEEIRKTAEKLDTGHESREGDCPIQINYVDCIKKVFDPDTLECVLTEDIDPEDRQMPLPYMEEEQPVSEPDPDATAQPVAQDTGTESEIQEAEIVEAEAANEPA